MENDANISNLRKTLEESGNFTPEQIDGYVYIASIERGEIKSGAFRELGQKSRTQPAFWDDRQYNNPSQPVVGHHLVRSQGILRLAFGRPAEDLPPARRGRVGSRRPRPDRRVYPWGNDWDDAKPTPSKAASWALRRPAPMPPPARRPFGAEDQAGNVWEWTSSLYLPYPYDPAESEQAEIEGGACGAAAGRGTSIVGTPAVRTATGDVPGTSTILRFSGCFPWLVLDPPNVAHSWFWISGFWFCLLPCGRSIDVNVKFLKKSMKTFKHLYPPHHSIRKSVPGFHQGPQGKATPGQMWLPLNTTWRKTC